MDELRMFEIEVHCQDILKDLLGSLSRERDNAREHDIHDDSE